MPISTFRAVASALVITLLAAHPAAAEKSKRAAPKTPPPAATIRPDSSHRAGPARGRIARTPGPLVALGSPIEDRTTILPFPVPGDTSRAASERAKMMNVPRQGLTLTEPPPRGTSFDVDQRTGGLIWKGGARPGTSVEPPRVLDTVPERTLDAAPEYPKAARDAGWQGTVWVATHVLADGTVGEAALLHSFAGLPVLAALDSSAVDAVRKMKFKPATAQGKPVDAWMLLPITFTLH